MKQHEIEALKPCPFCSGKAELFKNEDGCGESYDVKCLTYNCFLSEGADWWLNKDETIELWNKRSLPAPDDGLREGLEELVAGLKNEAADLDNCGFLSKYILALIEKLKKILDKTPDGWQPIADAPRDGRKILFCRKSTGSYIEVEWNEKNKRFEDCFGQWQALHYFTHYRGKPAPPRECKECES